MKSEMEIEKILNSYVEEYLRFMNSAGKFTPKHKYTLQGKIDALRNILDRN